MVNAFFLCSSKKKRVDSVSKISLESLHWSPKHQSLYPLSPQFPSWRPPLGPTSLSTQQSEHLLKHKSHYAFLLKNPQCFPWHICWKPNPYMAILMIKSSSSLPFVLIHLYPHSLSFSSFFEASSSPFEPQSLSICDSFA